MNLYLFTGLGADERLFENLRFESEFNIIYVEYPVPEADVNMTDYAKLLGQQIDSSQPFGLIGVSIGGMICSELV